MYINVQLFLDSSPSVSPEKKKKIVGYKIDSEQLQLIKEDVDNKNVWEEAQKFTKEGGQVNISLETKSIRIIVFHKKRGRILSYCLG